MSPNARRPVVLLLNRCGFLTAAGVSRGVAQLVARLVSDQRGPGVQIPTREHPRWNTVASWRPGVDGGGFRGRVQNAWGFARFASTRPASAACEGGFATRRRIRQPRSRGGVRRVKSALQRIWKPPQTPTRVDRCDESIVPVRRDDDEGLTCKADTGSVHMAEGLDSVTLYFGGVRSCRNVTKEDVSRLWRLAKKGRPKAKKRIVGTNLRLVIPHRQKILPSGRRLPRLDRRGNLGLMHAVDKFDPKRGFRFSTYAAYWIQQAVRRAYDEQSKTIHISPHAQALRKWLRNGAACLSASGRNPLQNGKTLNLSARQIKASIDATRPASSVGSWTLPWTGTKIFFVRDIVSDRNDQGPDEVFSYRACATI